MKISFLLFSTLLIFSSCQNSAKSFFVNGSEWLIQIPENTEKSHDVLKFNNNGTISNGERNNYNFNWIDDNSIKLKIGTKEAILTFSKIEENNCKVAILYENESKPKTSEDWIKLTEDERVLELVKYVDNGKSLDSYVINGVKIPSDKVPPAGIYIQKRLEESRSDLLLRLKVIIENGNIRFQIDNDYYGEDYNNANVFNDIPITHFGENGIFMLKNFNYGFLYQGSGVIECNDGMILVAEGEPYAKYPLLVDNLNNEYKNILREYINRANDYGFIFKNGGHSGKIVKIELDGFLPHEYGAGVTPLDVPVGKMWTPLFYEQVKGKKDNDFLDIFFKTRSGYTYNDYNRFELKKKDFVSVKLSKQNNTAFTRKDNVAVIVTSYSRTKTTFIFYCLEEDI